MKLPIPSAVFDQHSIILGKTRSGKSSKMRVMVEWLLEHKKRVVILSPKDDWYGLRLSEQGHDGYPVVIFGGKHADVEFSPSAGGAIAQLICSGNRPAIITFARQPPTVRTRFYIEFMESLFKHHQGELYVVIDEVHNFAPKGKVFSPEAGMMLHWSNVLAAEGQGQGLIMLAASQRPQKVHNDLLTSCETLIACRVIHKADRDAIKDWIDGAADPKIGAQVLADLAQMPRNEAWCWSPEIAFGPKRVAWPMFETFDSFRPQGQTPRRLKGWASVDLDAVKTQLADVVKEAEENDPKALKAEIQRLTSDLAFLRRRETQKEAQPAIDTAAGLRREQEAYQKGHAVGVAWTEKIFRERIVEISRDVTTVLQQANRKLPPVSLAPGAQKSVRQEHREAEALRKARTPTQAERADIKRVVTNAVGDTSLSPGERKILTLAVQFGGSVLPETVTVMTGLKRSSRGEYVSRLRKKGLLEPGADSEGAYVITQTGQDALGGAVEPLPTGKALQDYWEQKLSPGEWKILHVLIRNYPNWIDAEQFEAVIPELKRSSRGEYLSRLAAKQLIERASGKARASRSLM